jgi:CRP/FNR family transcriptional regulator, cyclic AMP receptor protein
VSDLLDLSSDLPVVTVAAGEVLIEEGTPVGRLLVLVSGEVVVEHDGVPFARIDSPGSVFGEMSAILVRPATATVRAVGEVRLHVADDPIAFLTDRPGAALQVLRATASRLDGMTQYLVDVKRQYADAEGHLGMVDRILDTLLHHQGPASSPGSQRDPEGDHSDQGEGL